jgi:arylformamidase
MGLTKMAQIYDITPKISPELAVFPGDQAFERVVAMSFAGGHHLDLSSIKASVHIGAHADAPSHYAAGGVSIEQRPLGLYMGKAQVVRVKNLGRGERIGLQHLSAKIVAPRVLFYTGSFPDPNKWNSDFCSLSPELLEALARQKVRLVGIDTPSVDPQDSKALEAHQILFKHDYAVLEGLVLTDVPEGIYTLIALPLPIVGGDASPVRAVLLPLIENFPEL